MNSKSETNVFIYGTGGHSLVVSEILKLQGINIAFYMDRKESITTDKFLDKPLISEEEFFNSQQHKIQNAVIAVGNSQIREKITQKLEKHGIKLFTAIHPSAIISPTATIGAGSVICAGAIIGTKVTLGKNVIINTKASIDHECILENYVQVAPGAVLCGNVQVGSHTFIGAGSSIKENLSIGEHSVIAMGAAVIKDIPDQVLCAGIPAKIVRSYKK